MVMVSSSSVFGSSDNNILVVDDDLAVGVVLTALLKQAGYHAEAVDGADKALMRVSGGMFDLIITDLNMPEMDGMELIEQIKKKNPELPVVMLTAHGTIHTAVEAMKKGATDFLTKPFEKEEVLYVVQKALEPAKRTTHTPSTGHEHNAWIWKSKAMQGITEWIEKAARSSATILLQGKSGTGKEVAARRIHAHSYKSKGPFIAVHCAALPENLLESELFGFEKGAFTGAVSRKPGRVELAHGGTLFLDEIGEISLNIQAKLLRLLQEKEYQRLGSTQTSKTDARFIAATHRDLEAMVKEGTFREDLYYRLRVLQLELPSLKDRREDIAVLAQHFLNHFATTQQNADLAFEPDALKHLNTHDWPGNIRELSNFIERLVIFTESRTITASDVLNAWGTLPTSEGNSTGELDLKELRQDSEKELVAEALKRSGGNRSQAARILGVSRRTLYNKMEEFRLTA